MSRKNIFTVLFAVAVFSIAGSAVFAQSAPVRGTVKLQKADGSIVPVEGATIDAFRTDLEVGKMPPATTNKRGEFSFVGFPLGTARFVLAVSGPGIGPRIQPDVKAGMETIAFVVNEGDGRRLGEAEAREAAKLAVTVAPTGLTEAQRAEAQKQRDDIAKKNAEIMAANKKAEDTNKIVNAALKAGDAAYKANNYDLAIAEFDKGIEADPDFEGTAPVLLNFRGVAYQKRAVTTYNSTATADAATRVASLDKIKPDIQKAIESFNQGLEVLKNTDSMPATEQVKYQPMRTQLLSNLLDSHGLAARLSPDPARDAKAQAVFDQYVAAETDPAKRNPLLLTYAANMNGAGELKLATVAYRKVLENDPNNLDALAGLGLALYSEGSMTSPPNKELLQEGLNNMQKFVDTAPDTHKLKESTKAIIEELKNEQKLAPQRTTTRKKG
jgi:tetratricopeptide (TPR) repeat protein